MAGVPAIQGNISYDFREAVNALARSTADAATLAARWKDLCDTETPRDVTVTLSSGDTMTVPNLAKALESMCKRSGDIDASSVGVHGPGFGVDVVPTGIDVGTVNAKYADNTVRTQHSYVTPYNTFHDAAYVLSGDTQVDHINFLAIPRYVWFNKDSGLDASNAHALVIHPLPASAALVKDRTDREGVCLCTEFMLINADPTRTGTFIIYNNAAGDSVALTVTLAPAQHARFLVWGWRGAATVNIIKM